jgi:hypothetical protein
MEYAALAPLMHSAPTVGWWLGLNAAEQAAWAGAVFGLLAAGGGFAAAWASYKAAKVALKIADDQAAREEVRYARRAEMHAAYMFNEIALVYGYIPRIQAPAAALKTALVFDAMAKINMLDAEASQLLSLVERIPKESIAELPEACAPHVAGAISSVRFVAISAKSLREKWQEAGGDIDHAQRIGKAIENRCVEIRTNLSSYVKYAKVHFGADIDDY